MSIAYTETYISTVDQSRTITLPHTVPIGTRVAVVLLPDADEPKGSSEREARFNAVMSVIREAQAADLPSSLVSDEEIDARIERARHSG
jgi:hypothetical protein